MSLAISAPLLAVGGAALKSASGFEQSLNIMQQVSGATAEQMAALEAQALDLGATTSFSAGDAADAMLELAKAGMSTEQVGAAIAGVMDLAAAGGLGLADAATITANAINAFGLDASDATGVANTFAAAANASSADVSDLAQGFQMAGAVFASNGQTVDDLAASLAILANNGIAGSDAGTSLKTMMMWLAAPTDEAAAQIASLGLSVYDAQGAMLPFGEIVGSLESATQGMSDAQRNAALSTIFGADAIRAATILAGEGSTTFDKMRGAVQQQGAAAQVAGARMAGFRGAIEYLKGSIDSFLIGTALPFLDMGGSLLRWVGDAITGFGNLSEPVKNAALAFAAVLAAAGPVMLAISGIVAVIAALTSPIGLVVVALAGLAAAWAADFGGIQEKTAA
jgi:TP901 family phage tail tape measure protein